MKTLLSNPYIVGNPIKSREMFFGREDDFQFVARKIGAGRSNQIVLLCGERRSGKTSILFQILGGRLGSSFLPILIDTQMLAGIKGDLEFFKAILKSGYAALQESGIEEKFAKPQKEGVDIERLLESFLNTVREKSTAKIILFLVDEYELIEAKIRDGTLSESTVHYLAGILESAFPISFVFTGSTNLEDRNPEIWRTILGKSVYRKISYLSYRDTMRLITEPLRDSVSYTGEVVESIFCLTGGQPFYTQVICQNLVDLLIEEERANPTAPDLERVVRDIVANPLPQMIYSWDSFAAWKKVMLSSLAGRLRGGSEWSNSRQIVQYIRDSRIVLPFNREKANVLLEEAYHAEFLEKNDAGSYRFRIDLFRRWIQREHSIWKAVKEADLGFRRTLQTGIVPVVIGVCAIATLVLAWFLLVPRIMPRFADWGRGRGLLPRGQASESSAAAKPGYVENVSFKANRGPFTLLIDDMYTHRSVDSRLGPSWIVIPSLAAGRHDFVASVPDGYAVERLDVLVSTANNSFVFYFPPPGAETQSGVSSPGPDSDTMENVESTPARDCGTLIISTEPSGATALLGDQNKGMTPLQIDIIGGYHPLWLMLDGYKTVYINLDIEAGKEYRQNVTLEEGWTVLAFDIQQEASVYIDGDYLVDLPTVTTRIVRSGQHVLSIVNKDERTSKEIILDLIPGDVFTVK
jgi:hypothetical protein